VESQVLPGGIDPDAYSVGARLTLPHTGAFTIGYLGDLEDAEAMITLVKAFGLIHERHPAARLVVEGDGPAKSQMIASLSRSGLLGTTCFLGRLPARKIPAVLAAIDIVVIPGPQPAGARIREAMLAATPIVCGIREASPIRDRITGVTSAPGDPASLASAIELLHEDRILRMRVGSTARRGVVSDQTWDDIAAALLDMAQPRDRRAIPLSEFIPAAESASHAL
jgi:glycosyltransferase involved in cell wall biosynthesis